MTWWRRATGKSLLIHCFRSRGGAGRGWEGRRSIAEGVDAVLWQTIPVPAQPVFQTGEGYGGGCPWTCSPTRGRQYVYRAQDYPETVKLIEASLVICSESRPIFCQSTELMERTLRIARLHDLEAPLRAVLERDDYEQPGKPKIRWDDPEQRRQLLKSLVHDALRLLAAARKLDPFPADLAKMVD